MTIQQNESTKVTVSLKNFDSANTPANVENIANWILKLAAAAIIIGGTIAAPPLSIAVGSQIVMYAGVVGTLAKSLSKLFGVEVNDKSQGV